MGSLAMNCCWTSTDNASTPNPVRGNSAFISGKFIGVYNTQKGFKFGTRAFASRRSVKKLRRDGKLRKNEVLETKKSLSDESKKFADGPSLEDDYVKDDYLSDNFAAQNSINFPSRGTVLQACTVTSGLIAALGIIIRQASHIASTEGLPIIDCSAEVSFGFEMWHLELITGLVILISSCRYLLLTTWPDFAESSEAANQQVLTSLQPLDYIVVAFLPGVSEELLFRGALLPLFGINWNSVLVVASIFGVLHFGSGRKYSFAVWATFVGVAYGYATIVSSNIIVPMASHALNNLVGGILWRYKSKTKE